MSAAPHLLGPLMLVLALAAGPASAQEADARSSAEADELFRKAGQAYDAADFELARSLYEKAFDKKKTHDIAAMLAQTEMKLGKPCEAEPHLAWAVASFPPSLTDERRARILRAHAEVKKQIGALRVETSPPGAAVQIDFQPVAPGALPGPLCAAAGQRVVFVSHEGYAVERRLVTVEPGATATVTVEMRRFAPPVGAPLPTSTPRRATSLVPPLTTSFPPPNAGTPVAFAGLSVAIGGVLAASILLPLALDKGNQAGVIVRDPRWRTACLPDSDHQHKVACTRLQSLREDQALLLNAGVSSLAFGAGLGAVALGFLLSRPPTLGVRPGGPHVTVGAAQDGAFVALTGAF